MQSQGKRVEVIDGDEIRRQNPVAIGYSKQDRDRNVLLAGRRALEVVSEGHIAIAALISPYDITRKRVRQMFAVGSFALIHVATPLETCEMRDPKGLYAKARAREIAHFTGVSDVYEPPTDAELVLDTTGLTAVEAVAVIQRAMP